MLTVYPADNQTLLGLINEATVSATVMDRFKKALPPARREELASLSPYQLEKLLREQLRSSKFLGEDESEGFFLRNEPLQVFFMLKVKKRGSPYLAKILTLRKGSELLNDTFKSEDEITW